MVKRRSVLNFVVAFGVALSSCLFSSPTHAAVAAKWCWTMQGDGLRGTFSTTGTMPGDGTAVGSTYNITDMSVYQSSFPAIEPGSISNGTYAFGVQPPYQIVWSGAAVTGFWRNAGGAGGTFTNGFSINNGSGGSGARLGFGIGFQEARTVGEAGPLIFQSNVTPAVIPVPASGLCAGESAPQTTASQPSDWFKSYGRFQDQTCANGWSPSWAEWPKNGTGGYVCNQILSWTPSGWIVR